MSELGVLPSISLSLHLSVRCTEDGKNNDFDVGRGGAVPTRNLLPVLSKKDPVPDATAEDSCTKLLNLFKREPPAGLAADTGLEALLSKELDALLATLGRAAGGRLSDI